MASRSGQSAETGTLYITDEMEAFQSELKAAAGVTLTASSSPFSDVVSAVFQGCSFSSPCSNWGLSDYQGWGYLPDFLPTGEEIFTTGATSNIGDYSNATDDANIVATEEAPTYSAEIAAIDKYEDYLVRQLPVL